MRIERKPKIPLLRSMLRPSAYVLIILTVHQTTDFMRSIASFLTAVLSEKGSRALEQKQQLRYLQPKSKR